MIQIQPQNDKAALQTLCADANIPYTASMRGAVMLDGLETLGYSLFTFHDGYAVIHDLKPVDDLALADGMLRSTIHMALQNNCLSVYYADSAPAEIFAKLGFIMNRKERQLQTHKLFDTCGGCK